MHPRSRHAAAFTSILLALALGALLGALATWALSREKRAPASATPPAVAPAPRDDGLARKLREWRLTPEDLERELASATRILREKTGEVGRRVVQETLDARIITVIKAKLTLDEELSAWDISVACNDGRVSLAGTVDSSAAIGRAIVLALDTEGVKEVNSSLRVQP